MKKLILIGGLPASGKTMLGAQIAHQIGAVLLDIETISHNFTAAILQSAGKPAEDRESAFYTEKIRPLEYGTMLEIARVNLVAVGGKHVVCTAPFFPEFYDSVWVGKMRDQFKISFLWTVADEKTLIDRMTQKGGKRYAWKLEHWREWYDATPKIAPVIQDGWVFHTDQETLMLEREEYMQEFTLLQKPMQ